MFVIQCSTVIILNLFMKCSKAVSIFIQTQVSVALHAFDVLQSRILSRANLALLTCWVMHCELVVKLIFLHIFRHTCVLPKFPALLAMGDHKFTSFLCRLKSVCFINHRLKHFIRYKHLEQTVWCDFVVNRWKIRKSCVTTNVVC